MGVETKFCRRPSVGSWRITQSQRETVTTVGKFGGKRTNLGHSVSCAPWGAVPRGVYPQYPDIGCSGLLGVESAPLWGRFESNRSSWKHEMVPLEHLVDNQVVPPKSSPIQQWGHHLSIPVPTCDTGEGVLTPCTQRCRRRPPQGSAGPTSTGSCAPAARHQAGGVRTCLQPPR